MTTPRGVSSSVAVADPGYPDRVIKPNADGSVNVVLGGGPTSPGYVLDGVYTEKGYQQITNLLASTALTVSTMQVKSRPWMTFSTSLSFSAASAGSRSQTVTVAVT